MSKDVTASESGTSLSVFCSEYPKELIKTRPTNRTDDIPGDPAVARTSRRSTTHRVCTPRQPPARVVAGAQADTRCFGPLLWLQPGKDPSKVIIAEAIAEDHM